MDDADFLKSENTPADGGYGFRFGKYKGRTVAQALALNPGYLVWAHDNVGHFSLDADLLAQARAADDQGRIRRSYARSFGSYGNWYDDPDYDARMDAYPTHDAFLGLDFGDL